MSVLLAAVVILAGFGVVVILVVAFGAAAYLQFVSGGSVPAPEAGEGDGEPRPEAVPEGGWPAIRLGVRAGGGELLVGLPGGLARHVSIFGRSGSGKTTTIIRMSHDALAVGYAVVVVDAKGTGALRDAAEDLARKFGVPFRLLDPKEPEKTMRYSPVKGEPADVSNKLVGAFRYGASAEVFKQIGQELVLVLAAALKEVGVPVTLKTLAGALDYEVMEGLAKRGGEAGKELAGIKGRPNVVQSGLAGMRSRLNALRRGTYGPVFDVDSLEGGPELDFAEALSGGVTYVSLPMMAASEDSELMARVVVQDLKQVAFSRLAARRVGGPEPPPAMLVCDEFAGMEEADQIMDLLLQAREARVSVVLSTQLLPRSDALRETMLGAGLVVAHAVNDAAAVKVAQAFGGRRRTERSRTTYEEREGDGGLERGGSTTSKSVRKLHVEPDEILDLGVGEAVVRSDGGGFAVRPVRVTVIPAELGDRNGKEAGVGG